MIINLFLLLYEAIKQKVHRENVSMYTFIEKSQYGNWLHEEDLLLELKEQPSNSPKFSIDRPELVSPEEIGLMLAIAYEGLGKRELSINALIRAKARFDSRSDYHSLSSSVCLLLTKLLFRSNRKADAERVIVDFLGPLLVEDGISVSDDRTSFSSRFKKAPEDIADAFYILGD